jgi:hypothetical protein
LDRRITVIGPQAKLALTFGQPILTVKSPREDPSCKSHLDLSKKGSQ